MHILQIILTIIKAMIIGISGSIPVGPIVILSLQRSFQGGRKAGMAAASGAIVSDTLYAIIAVFAFSAISDFLTINTGIIKLVGGIIIVVVGISMVVKRKHKVQDKITNSRIALDATKSILMGLSNPGCLLWILGMFAAFHMDPHSMPGYMSVVMVAGVTAGSLLYWLVFTKVASKGNGSFKIDTLLKINKYAGLLISFFGLILFISGLEAFLGLI